MLHLVLWALLILGLPAVIQASVLGSGELLLAGTQLTISPETQTVPLDLPTIIETEILGFESSQGSLPPALRILGNLTGPEISGVLELQTSPNEPFRIPRFRLEGEYTLDNIRLVDGDEFLAWSTPRRATILVTQVLITSVESRPLTAEEIGNLGLVIDENRYQALSLTFGFAVAGGTIHYNMPVVYDLYGGGVDGDLLQPFPAVNVPLPEFGGGTLPPSGRFRPQLVPFKLDLKTPPPPEIPHGGCSFQEGECRERFPPTPPMVGVILFPTDLRLLHQFFSVVLIVQNGAPGDDPLVLRDLSAKIKLPAGLRQSETVPSTPLGVPVPVRVPGADGELGTADDLSLIIAQAKGEADFQVEGLDEGTHIVEFDLEGIVDGLPGGAQRVVGKAKGAVVVRDPNLGVTIHHPMTVRSGEEYPLKFTVSNTGVTFVNDLDIELPASGMSGAELVNPQANVQTIDRLLPGDSATVEFQVRALRTGAVVSTSVKTGSQINPHWEFSLGVGVGGVPLSPDTLVLPQAAQSLPAGLLESALRVIGLGHSLSVALEASLGEDLPRIGKATINERIYRVTQAGRTLELGENVFDAVAILAAELYGSRDQDYDWNLLLQKVAGAKGLATEIGNVLRAEVSSADQLFERFAATTHFLGPQAALVDGAGAHIEVVSRVTGKKLAGVAADEEARIRELPFAELFDFADGELAFLTVPEPEGYRVTMRQPGGGSASLRILLPDPSGALRTLSWSGVTVNSLGSAWTDFSDTDAAFSLEIDADGDGFAESSVPAQIEVLAPRPFEALSARQNSEIDPSGHVLDVLFSADIDLASLWPRDAQHFVLPDNVSNGGLMPVEADLVAGILAGGGLTENPFEDLFNSRLVRVIFSSPVSPLLPHMLTVNDLASSAGQTLAQQSLAVVTTASSQGVVVEGRVIGPDGLPVAFAEVILKESDLSGIGNDTLCVQHVTATTQADGNGFYRFPYVRETACGDVFTIEGRDLIRHKKGTAKGRVRFFGTTQELDVLMLGRGTLRGLVTYADGTVPPGLQVFAENPVFDDGRRAHVDSDGFYNVADVAVGTVQLLAHDEQGHFAYATVELPVAGAVVDKDIILQDLEQERWTGQLRGTVLGTAGEPVVDAWVALYVGGQLITTLRSNSQGGFDFGVVPATTDDDPATIDPGLTAEIEAFPSASSVSGGQLFFEIRKDQVNEIEVQLSDDRGSVEGHVYLRAVDGSLTPMAGAPVWLQGLPFNTVTDSLGFYRMEDVFSGTWGVRAADVEAGKQGSTSVTVGATNEAAIADIYFSEGLAQGGVTGRVVNHDGVTPVAGATVHLTGGVWAVRWYHQAITDSGGNFAIPGVGPGQFWASAVKGSDGGLAPFTVRFPGDTPTVEVKFRKGTIRIRTVAIQADGSSAPVCSTAVGRTTTVVPKYGNIVAVNDQFSSYFTCPMGEEATAEFLEVEALEGPYEFHIYNAFHGTRKISRYLGDGEVAEHVIEFLPNGSIGGVVYDIDGSPAVGATVELTSPPPPLYYSGNTGPFEAYDLETDSAGRFLFDLVPKGSYDLTVTHDSGPIFRKDRVRVHLARAGEHLELEMELPKQGSVIGWVQDGAGLPVAGAVVELNERSFPHRKLIHNADDLGNFAFHNVFVGDVSVRAQVPALGGLGTTKELAVDAENQDVYTVMTLASVGEITGQVIYPDGLGPAAGSRVELHAGGFFDVVTADGNGEFRFRLLPVGMQFRVQVFDPSTGRFGTGSSWVALDYHGQVQPTVATLEARGEVHGTVIDGEVEEGLPATVVRLRSQGLQWFTAFATTDESGHFEFGGIPEGDFDLSVQTGGAGRQRTARGSGVLLEEDQVVIVDLQLTPFAVIGGQVWNPAGSAGEGSLFSGEVNTWITSGDSQVVGASFDNPFEFGGIVPRQGYRVTAQEVGGSHRVKSGTLVVSENDADGRLDVDLQMPAIGSTTISVFDSFGDPVAHAEVSVVNAHALGGERFEGNTGNDHRITFDGLIEGSVRASVTDPVSGLKGSNSASLTLEGEEIPITVNLQASGTVRGAVVLADGSTPAEGAIVSIYVNAWSKYFLSTADELGGFEFDGLPMSSFTLTVQEYFGPGTIERFGALSSNGQVNDFGTLVLDDRDPYVVSIEPATGSRDILESANITIVFSEPIDVGRFSGSHIRLENFAGSSVAVGFSWSADGRSVTVDPTLALASATAYVVRVLNSIVDPAGRHLSWEQRSSFTTRDYISPDVIDIVPRDGAVQVPVDASIDIRFSEPITDLLMPAFSLWDITDGPGVSQTAVPQRSSELRYVLTPALLVPDRHYRVDISAAQDVAGNVMQGTVSTTFWTPDETPPQNAWVSPTENASFTAGDDIAAEVTATDNRGIDRVEFAIGDWTFVSKSLDSQFVKTLLAPVVAVAGDVVVTATAIDIFGNQTAVTRTLRIEPHMNGTPPSVDPGCWYDGDFVAPGLAPKLDTLFSDDERIESYTFFVDGVELDRLSPVNAATASKNFFWQPPWAEDAPPGTSFLLRVEARDFAGNVGFFEATMSVPGDGPLLRADQILNPILYVGQPVYLADGEFLIYDSSLPFLRLTLLRDAVVRTEDAPGLDRLLDLAVDESFTLQCQSRIEADSVTAPTVFAKEGSVLDAPTLDTANLSSEGLVAVAELDATVAVDVSRKGVVEASTLTTPELLIADLGIVRGNALSFDVNVSGTLTIESGARLDSSGAGYSGGTPSSPAGLAPSWVSPSRNAAGGSHGGVGTTYRNPWYSEGSEGPAGEIYDSVYQPRLGGAGGAYRHSFIYTGGGGFIDLEAGTLVLHGEIASRGASYGLNGADDDLFAHGAGAGGAVQVRTGSLLGAGVIDVSGGSYDKESCDLFWSWPTAGAGGGGRAAIYTTTSGGLAGFDPATQIKAWGGSHGCTGTVAEYAAPGTVLIHTPTSTYGDLWVDAGVAASGAMREGASTTLPSLEAGDVAALEAQGLDAWLTGSAFLRPRWLGVWVMLSDPASSDLGAFKVLDLDLEGRALLEGAAAVAGIAASYRAEYHFDELFLGNGATLTAKEPIEVSSLVFEGAASVGAEVVAVDVLVKSGATVVPAAGGDLTFRVSGTMTVEAGATIDVSGGGYDGTSTVAQDPAGAPSWVSASVCAAGGSHGGRGTIYGYWDCSWGPAGEVFGSVYEPGLGGGGGAMIRTDVDGGDGGGILVIEAGQLVLDGQLLARGQSLPSVTEQGAGGAGGSILVRTAQLSGAGLIDASGGNNIQHCIDFPNAVLSAGAGGGGRVAVYADTLLGFDSSAQARAWGGYHGCPNALQYAAPGTILTFTSESTYGSLIVDAGTKPGGIAPNLGTFLPTLGSGAVVTLEAEGPDLWLTGSSALFPRWIGAWVKLSDASGSSLGLFRVAERDPTGRLLLEGAAGASSAVSYEGHYLFDTVATVNGADLTAVEPIEAGALTFDAGVTTISGEIVATEVLVKTGAIVRQASGSDLVFKVSGTMTVESAAQLDVSATGYEGKPWSGGDAYVAGAPPWVTGSLCAAGGSYGGSGSVFGYWPCSWGPAGDVYGSVYEPWLMGGGGSVNGNNDGGRGGGRIYIEAGELVLDGELLARGESHPDVGDAAGGGAGGSILIETSQLSGSGVIDASGGTNVQGCPHFNGSATAGAGGGGRIGIYADTLLGFDPSSQARAWGGYHGCPTALQYAGAGTVFIFTSESTYGSVLIDAGFQPGGSASTLSTVFPTLSSGEPTVAFEVVGADAWMTGSGIFHPRWLGTYIRLRDPSSEDLGLFQAIDLDSDGRVLLIGAASAAPLAATYSGEYWFDDLDAANGASWIASDPVLVVGNQVSVAAAAVSAAEDDPAGMVFTVTLSEIATSDVSVEYTTVDGSAIAGSDYVAASGTLIIPDGQMSAQLTVALTADTVSEPAETFELHLLHVSPGFLVAGATQAVATINNDDTYPQLSVSDQWLTEGRGNSNYAGLTISLDPPASEQIIVNYQTTAATATAAIDYVELSGSMIFLTGESSKTITVEVLSDSLVEEAEVVWLDVTSDLANLLDPRGEVTIYDAQSQVPDTPHMGGALVDFEDNATQIVQENPSWSLYNGGAPWAGKTLAAVETGDKLKLRTRPEFIRTDHKLVINVMNSSWSGYSISVGPWTSPVRYNSQHYSPVDFEDIEFTIPRDYITSETFEVTFTAGSNSTGGNYANAYRLFAATDDQDFQRGVNYHWFGSGWVWNGGEWSRKELTYLSDSSTGTIPMVTSSPDDPHTFYLGTLDDRGSSFQIQVGTWTSSVVTVTQDGGSVFEEVAIDIPSGTIPGKKFDVTVINRTVPAGGFGAQLYSIHARLVRKGQGSAIVDFEDDAFHISEDSDCLLYNGGAPWYGKAMCYGRQGEASTGATITVNTRPEYLFRDHKLIVGVPNDRWNGFQISVNGWTSAPHSNSQQLSPVYHENIEFLIPGHLITSSQLTVTFLPAPETTFSDLFITSYQLLANSADQEHQRAIDYYWADGWDWFGSWNTKRKASVPVAAGEAPISMSTSTPNDAHLFYLTTLDDRASSFKIRVGSWTSEEVTAPQDGGSLFAELAVAIPAHTIPASDFEVTVISTMSGTLFSTEARLVRLGVPKGNLPVVTLGPAALSAAEGDPAGMVLTIALSEAWSEAVVVGYETAALSAQEGVDYVGTSGSVIIPVGATSAQITVPVIDDALLEADEAFEVRLAWAINAALAGIPAVATILDNETELPDLSVEDLWVIESADVNVQAELVLTLDIASGEAITIDYATTPGTAAATSDYLGMSSSLTFLPGETTKTISVDVLPDLLVEGEEYFGVSLAASPDSRVNMLDSDGEITVFDAQSPLPEAPRRGGILVDYEQDAKLIADANPTIALWNNGALWNGRALTWIDAGDRLLLHTRREFLRTDHKLVLWVPNDRWNGFSISYNGWTSPVRYNPRHQSPIHEKIEFTIPYDVMTEESFEVTVNIGPKNTFPLWHHISGYELHAATADQDRQWGVNYHWSSDWISYGLGNRKRLMYQPIDSSRVIPMVTSRPEAAHVFYLTVIDDRESSFQIQVGSWLSPPMTAPRNTNNGFAELAVEIPAHTIPGRAFDITVINLTPASAWSGLLYTTEARLVRKDSGSARVDSEDDAYFISTMSNCPIWNGGALWNGKAICHGSSGSNVTTLSLKTRPEHLFQDHKLILGVLNDRWSGYRISVNGWTSADRTNSQNDVPAFHDELTFVIPGHVVTGTQLNISLTRAANTTDPWLTGYELIANTGDQELLQGVNYYRAGSGWVWTANMWNRKYLVELPGPASASATIPMSTSHPEDPHLFYLETLDDRASSFQIQVGNWTSSVVTAPQDGGSPFVELAIEIPAETIPATSFDVTVINTTSATLYATTARLARLGPILDDDIPQMSISDVGVTENPAGSIQADLLVTLDPPPLVQASVSYQTLDGTAMANEDYVAQSGTLIFPPGQSSQPISIEVLSDQLAELEETFTVQLSSPTGATILDAVGAITVSDSDAAPIASFTYACKGLTCSLDASGSTDDVSVDTYQWDFGDGATVSVAENSTAHRFPLIPGGQFQVQLTVIDSSGQQNTSTQTIAVISVEKFLAGQTLLRRP